MKKRIAIFLLYFFLATGGLWNALGLFQPLMSFLAPWMVLLLGIGGALFAILQNPGYRRSILAWTVGVFFLSLAAEILGVNTGFPFGHYAYGKNMAPFIWNTPIAIGGAWLSVILSSVFLVRLMLRRMSFFQTNSMSISFATALTAAILAVSFDALMEFAAVKLGYWTWQGDTVPIQNYLSWLVLSFVFSLAALRTFAGSKIKTSEVWHLYPAQLIYFFVSLF